MQLLDFVDKPGLVDVPLFDSQGEDHQVAHTEVVLRVQVGCYIAVAGRQQRIRVVANIQVFDLKGCSDGGH